MRKFFQFFGGFGGLCEKLLKFFLEYPKCELEAHMKSSKVSNLPNVTQDIDWQKYPHAARWVKKIETEEKKRIASERDEKSFTELEKKVKSNKKLGELRQTLEARTRGRVNYYLHKNKEIGRMCFLKLIGNNNIDFLRALDRFYNMVEKSPTPVFA